MNAIKRITRYLSLRRTEGGELGTPRCDGTPRVENSYRRHHGISSSLFQVVTSDGYQAMFSTEAAARKAFQDDKVSALLVWRGDGSCELLRLTVGAHAA